MKRIGGWFVVFLGMISLLHAVEAIESSGDDEWDKEVEAAGKAAEKGFAAWKSTGKMPEDFEQRAIYGAREDLVQRLVSGDKLLETEIKTNLPATACEVTVRDTAPFQITMNERDIDHRTVWRRITKDRFEIWTPKSGKLYDAKGKQIAEAKVHRGDGWGREWYGAFLPDGRWITTDIDERDDRVTAFSAKGKQLWSVKGATLIPKNKDPDAMDSLPLIAWARSDKDGKAWIVSVGSEFGRGYIKLTPYGKWTNIENPWTECFPQQLRSRGMYTDRCAKSDDGAELVNRTEASHGMYVGWPHYYFPKSSTPAILIPNGDDFGILPDSWSVFIESDCSPLITASAEGTAERKEERVWFFDAKGTYQHWVKGRTVRASLPTGGLWIRQLDDSCVLVEKGYSVKSHLIFATKEKQTLVPVEFHDDIKLGVFLIDGKLVLGSWE